MALKRNAVSLGKVAMPEINGSGLVAFRMSYTLTADLAAGDIIDLGFLPADAVPVDLIFDHAALGAGTVSVGLLNEGKTDLTGTAWVTAVAVTAAGASRADAGGLRAMATLAATELNRSVGAKIVTDTSATSGEIGLTLYYRTR